MKKTIEKDELKVILLNAVARECELYIGGFLYLFNFDMEEFVPVEDYMVLTNIPLSLIDEIKIDSYTEMTITFKNNRSPQSFIIKEKVNPIELLVFKEW